MIILVSDTSVLIDLERGGLLETVFATGLPLVVPDLLYEQELANANGPYLKALGLVVVSLNSEEVEVAQQLRNARPGLSVADCFALSCAARPNHLLVTGDGLLRKEATKRLGEVHGLLWLLDQIKATGKASVTVLSEGLTKISQHPRARLPKEEVQRRMRDWNT